MPITKYTYKNQKLLESFIPIPNFSSNSFTFFNKKTGKVIVDAIRTDNVGNVIFKDSSTELYLKDIVANSQSIEEDNNIDGSFTLYFTDKFNKKHSLGDIYKNLLESQPKNLIYWFGKRVSRKLNEGMDLNIFSNYIKTSKEIDTFNPTKNITNIELKNTWKNKWIDIPCLEIITPDYVNDKFASISATVIFKIKANKPIITGFRIYDATAGIELIRTIHTSERNPNKFITYTIPLHYQGELPDTKQPTQNDFTGMTYHDIQNIQFEKGQEKGKEVTKNSSQYETIPETQHILKLQWITCDLAIELNNIGKPIGDFGRFFDNAGDSSLDVTIFSNSLNTNQVIQLNGSIETNFLEKGMNVYTHEFDKVPLGLTNDYFISFSTNKNINISLIKKTISGFVIKWFKPIKGLIIDWNIIHNIKKDDSLDLELLTDPKRDLNYFKFLDKQIATDFCNEVVDIGGFEFFPVEVIEEFEPDCVCCDCCSSLKPKVNFILTTGGEKPTPQNDTFTIEYNPSSITNNLADSAALLSGNFNNTEQSTLIVGNNQFFNFNEVIDLAGLKNITTFIESISSSTNIPKIDNLGNIINTGPVPPPLLSTTGFDISSINEIWSVNVISITNGHMIEGVINQTNNTGFSINLISTINRVKPLWLTTSETSSIDPFFAISNVEIINSFPNITSAHSRGQYMGKVNLNNSIALGDSIFKIDPTYANGDFYFTSILESGGVILWNGDPNKANSIPYARDVNGDIIAYNIGDKYAPDPSLFRFKAIVTDFENDKCRSGIYVDLSGPFGGIGTFDSQYIIDEGFGSSTGNYNINYDTFIGFNSNTVAISSNTVIYSNTIKTSGFGIINPFFKKNNTYYVVLRSIKGLREPIIFLFEHTLAENIGSVGVAGLKGNVHLFTFFNRQEDPNATDGKDFLIYSWTPSKNITYADLHIDDLNTSAPIELVAITDKNPLLKTPQNITNALISRDLINKRTKFITNFPENESLINNYNILSGISGVSGNFDINTAIIEASISGGQISGASISGNACEDMNVTNAECSLLYNIDAILRFPDRLTRMKAIYQDNISLFLKGRFDNAIIQLGNNINNDFVIVSQLTVGINDTIKVVKTPITSCRDVNAPTNTNNKQDLTMKQGEWFDLSTKETGIVTESFIVKKTLTLSDIYESDFTFKGVEFVDDSEFIKYEDAIKNAFLIGIENLKYDKKQQRETLPAQLISDNLINLEIPFASSYSSLFEEGTTYLKVNDPLKLKTIVVPTNGFLGISSFKYNIVIFDPRPNIFKTTKQRPLFPGFDPIYQKKSLEQILEHIYTTVYPTTNVPSFPNFRIGDIAINGENYNPLYDYRNYRLSGYYDPTQSRNNFEIFRSTPMRNINGNFVNSRYFKIGSEYYILVTNFHDSGAIITSRYGNKLQKVKPNTLKFERVSKTLFDFSLNTSIVI